MEFGWIDFSGRERAKVMNILSLLEEGGMLDELGIAPIRDAFSDVFFPGTSTIQTVPKYFFVVAYILKDFEKSSTISREKAMRDIRDAERKVCEILGDRDGVIGRLALKSKGNWLKRTPADIYWAGMRRYGILTGGRMSMGEFVRSKCGERAGKALTVNVGKKESDGYEVDMDDDDAGLSYGKMHINMLCYRENWMNNELDIRLTAEEGTFLKNRIIENCPDTMLAYVLENNIRDFCLADSFKALEAIAEKHTFPEKMKKQIKRAKCFSEFVYVTRIVYNMIVCPHGEADEEFESYKDRMKEIGEAIDIDELMYELKVSAPSLKSFLTAAKAYMIAENVEGLKDAVAKREKNLKTTRARCAHPGEYKYQWYGGGELDYRFGTAKRLVRDIFESEGL